MVSNYLHRISNDQNMDPLSDPWSVLGIHRGSDEESVKNAFKRLARIHHPDKSGDAARFKEVHAAYKLLLHREIDISPVSPDVTPTTTTTTTTTRRRPQTVSQFSLSVRRFSIIGFLLFALQMVSILSTNSTNEISRQIQIKNTSDAPPAPAATTEPPIRVLKPTAIIVNMNTIPSQQMSVTDRPKPIQECQFGGGWNTDLSPQNISASSAAHTSAENCQNACNGDCHCWAWQPEGECSLFDDASSCTSALVTETHQIFGLKNCKLSGCNYSNVDLPAIDFITSPSPYCSEGSIVPLGFDCFIDAPLFTCDLLKCRNDNSVGVAWESNTADCTKLCPPPEGLDGCGYEPQSEGHTCTPILLGYQCTEHVCTDGEYIGVCIENSCSLRQLAIPSGAIADGCSDDEMSDTVKPKTLCAYIKLRHTCDNSTCNKGLWSKDVITCRPDSCSYDASFPISETVGCNNNSTVDHGSSCHYKYCTPIVCEMGYWLSKPECQYPSSVRGRGAYRNGRGRGR